MEYTTEQKVKMLLVPVIETIREKSFREEYRSQATDEECLGIAIAKYFEWDSRIFKAFYEALEDANFHKEAEEVTKWEDF